MTPTIVPEISFVDRMATVHFDVAAEPQRPFQRGEVGLGGSHQLRRAQCPGERVHLRAADLPLEGDADEQRGLRVAAHERVNTTPWPPGG